MADTPKKFTFICGADDFLVGRLGKTRFEALAAGIDDEFGREIIGGFVANLDEVADVVRRFREAVQTIPLFGGKRVVWLKDVNFLWDSVTGRAEGTLTLVEGLQELLAAIPPAEVTVLITASPVDRRRSFIKWCEKNADFVLVGGSAGDADGLAALATAEARAADASFAPGAVELLVARVGDNSRFLVEEIRKLAAYAMPAPIAEADVANLTPNVAEGDFFECSEAFFAGDLPWTLEALRRHFFAGGDARPVISSLQNRNRILIQVRTLMDAGEVRLGPRGLEGLAQAAAGYRELFGEAADAKSAYNLFSQHPYYLGKLLGSARVPTLRRLIDNQREFIVAFEEIVGCSDAEQEEALRGLAVRCLGTEKGS